MPWAVIASRAAALPFPTLMSLSFITISNRCFSNEAEKTKMQESLGEILAASSACAAVTTVVR